MKRVAGFDHAVRLALSATLVAGCGGAMAVQGEVVQPAQVPVRAFPRILVTAEDDPESRGLATAVAQHLARGRSAVQQLAPDAVRDMRANGRIERTTVIVHLQTIMSSHTRADWSPRNRGMSCGALGCFDPRGSSIRHVPVIHAELLVRVLDGPSGNTLQEVELAEEEVGDDELAMRMRVLERLAERTRGLLDQHVQRVVVPLYPLDHPAVRRALAALREGSWSAARRHLEELAHSRAFHGLPREHRALVLYDLGEARRFDTTMPSDERFDGASRALRAAVRLVPIPLYARALADLENHRRSRHMVREQQEAMAHNFAISSGAGDRTPEPPAQYRN